VPSGNDNESGVSARPQATRLDMRGETTKKGQPLRHLVEAIRRLLDWMDPPGGPGTFRIA